MKKYKPLFEQEYNPIKSEYMLKRYRSLYPCLKEGEILSDIYTIELNGVGDLKFFNKAAATSVLKFLKTSSYPIAMLGDDYKGPGSYTFKIEKSKNKITTRLKTPSAFWDLEKKYPNMTIYKKEPTKEEEDYKKIEESLLDYTVPMYRVDNFVIWLYEHFSTGRNIIAKFLTKKEADTFLKMLKSKKYYIPNVVSKGVVLEVDEGANQVSKEVFDRIPKKLISKRYQEPYTYAKPKEMISASKNKYLYRACSLPYLKSLLKNNKATVKRYNYTSLSTDVEIFYNSDFEEAEVIIRFDREELGKLNKLVEVQYNKDWFLKNLDIRDHVFSKKEVESGRWETSILPLSLEKEVVAPKTLKINDKCIVTIDAGSSRRNDNLRKLYPQYTFSVRL